MIRIEMVNFVACTQAHLGTEKRICPENHKIS
jgi:hypothetical protein